MGKKYADTAAWAEKIDEKLNTMKADILQDYHKKVEKDAEGTKECLEKSLILDITENVFGAERNNESSLDEVKRAFLNVDIDIFSPQLTLLEDIDYDDHYKQCLNYFQGNFQNITFINFEEYSKQIIYHAKELFNQKKHAIHCAIMQDILQNFMVPFYRAANKPDVKITSTDEDVLFGQKTAQYLVDLVKKPFLDQVLPEAIRLSFGVLEEISKPVDEDDTLHFPDSYKAHYIKNIRQLVGHIHDAKNATPYRYLKMKFSPDANPEQIVENLKKSIGVTVPPDAFAIMRSCVSEDGNSSDGVFLVLAFSDEEDYKTCLLHTVRVGESGRAVLERCPTFHVTSKKPLNTVPVILESFANFYADLLSISVNNPSGPSSDNIFRATVVCATEEWANIIASQPGSFFAYESESDGAGQGEFDMSVDPVEDGAYNHNAEVKQALPDSRKMFGAEVLKDITADSDIRVKYAWDPAMWLAYFKSCDPKYSNRYLALVALTTLQFICDRRVTVVERTPRLNPSLWAVKDPQKSVDLPGPLASGLLVVPTAGASLPAAAARGGETKVVMLNCSPLDAAKARESSCILLNVKSKFEEFGRGWKDGSFSRCNADEAEIMLGTALVPYMFETFKKELGALTENIGTEQANVALVRDLLVVREGVETGYRFVEERVIVNVACSEGDITDEQSFRKVATTLLTAAAKNGLRTVVVGNMCYSNEAKNALVDVVKSNFAGLFDEVVFASNNFFDRN